MPTRTATLCCPEVHTCAHQHEANPVHLMRIAAAMAVTWNGCAWSQEDGGHRWAAGDREEWWEVLNQRTGWKFQECSDADSFGESEDAEAPQCQGVPFQGLRVAGQEA